MRDYLSSEVRNVCVIGHSGAGKTSVLESMLYYTCLLYTSDAADEL